MSGRYDEFLRYQKLVPAFEETVASVKEGEYLSFIELTVELLGLTRIEALNLYPELREYLCSNPTTVPADD